MAITLTLEPPYKFEDNVISSFFKCSQSSSPEEDFGVAKPVLLRLKLDNIKNSLCSSLVVLCLSYSSSSIKLTNCQLKLAFHLNLHSWFHWQACKWSLQRSLVTISWSESIKFLWCPTAYCCKRPSLHGRLAAVVCHEGYDLWRSQGDMRLVDLGSSMSWPSLSGIICSLHVVCNTCIWKYHFLWQSNRKRLFFFGGGDLWSFFFSHTLWKTAWM